LIFDHDQSCGSNRRQENILSRATRSELLIVDLARDEGKIPAGIIYFNRFSGRAAKQLSGTSAYLIDCPYVRRFT